MLAIQFYNFLLNIAIRFGESDIYVKEGGLPRLAAVERTQSDLSKSVSIIVYLTTIEKYELREYGLSGCNLSLADLGIDESRDDPAESKCEV